MLLKQVLFKNFCQLTYLQWDLQAGLNIVVGPNGSGKSNTFRGIRGSLTGDFGSRTRGGKSQDRTFGIGDKEDTAIQTTWLLPDGREFTVMRNLTRTGEAKLHISDGTQLTGVEQDVTNEIARLTGFTPSMVETCMFIPQKEIDKVFTMTSSARVAGLQGLTDSAIANVADQVLREFEVQDKARIEDYKPETLAQAQTEFDAAKSDIPAIRRLRELKAEVLDTEEITRLSRLVAGFESRLQYAQKLRQDKADAEAVGVEIALCSKNVRKATEAVTQAKQELDKVKQELEESKTKLQSLELKAKAWKEMEKIKGELARPLVEFTEPLPKLLGDDEVGAGEKLRSELQQHQNTINMWDSEKCVTCGRPFKVSKEDYVEAKHSSKEISDRLSRIDDYAVAMQKWQKAKQTWEKDIAVAKVNRKNFKQQYEELKSANGESQKEVVADLSRLRTRIGQLYDVVKLRAEELEYAESDAQEAEELLNSHKEKDIKLTTRIESAESALRSLPRYAKEERAKIRKALADCQKKNNEIRLLEPTVAAATLKLHQSSTQLRIARREHSRVSKIKPVLTKIQSARKVLQQLPGRTIAELAARIEHNINARLAELGADFTLAVDTELEFTVTRHGYKFQQSRLSGGQACMAGLAFWMSVSSVMGMNSMFLDEPIDGLDEDGKSMLPDMLIKIDGMCRRANKQLVLITHNKSLVHIGHQLRIAGDC